MAERRRLVVSETLTAEQLRELLHYDPDTGIFTWRRFRGKTAKAGTRAGCANYARGHRYISVNCHKYLEHRLAWLYVCGTWPVYGIDHRDGNGMNNRWKNLRIATQNQNMQNARISSKNTSGFKGVDFMKHKGLFRARIRVNGEERHLGLYATAKDAHDTYAAAAKKHFGEFARF